MSQLSDLTRELCRLIAHRHLVLPRGSRLHQDCNVRRLAPSDGTASRNSGALQARRANAAVIASRTGPPAAGTSASTEPPNPPPIIRAPNAPAASAASTVASASGQEISKSSRSEACDSVSSRPISR